MAMLQLRGQNLKNISKTYVKTKPICTFPSSKPAHPSVSLPSSVRGIGFDGGDCAGCMEGFGGNVPVIFFGVLGTVADGGGAMGVTSLPRSTCAEQIPSHLLE